MILDGMENYVICHQAKHLDWVLQLWFVYSWLKLLVILCCSRILVQEGKEMHNASYLSLQDF